MKFLLIFLTLNLLHVAHADSVDDFIRSRLALFDIQPLADVKAPTSDEQVAKIELGKKLFLETNLSGNRNVSCHTCHNTKMGLSDALPLSRTEDTKGILKRHSQSLFNVGLETNHFMFWDGRVHFNVSDQTFTTPEMSFNGVDPKSKEIVNVLLKSDQRALAAQALFPLVSREEMRGLEGDNEIADAKNNLEAWDLVVKRITTESESARYMKLFNRAFPLDKKMNIGHVGSSMASFMKNQFHSNGSPFHRYLAGDNQAMTQSQKNGFMVFMERGRCIACHSGNTLGNNAFFASVAVPSYGAKPFSMDHGRSEVTGMKDEDFFFKTPSLINVSLSAPYMHNGAFRTLKEVIKHYNNVNQSIKTFDIDSERQKEFPVEVEVKRQPADLQALWSSIRAGFLRQGLNLSSQEVHDLEIFLTEALRDPKWQTYN
jgi:cytochrome c peroxidase